MISTETVKKLWEIVLKNIFPKRCDIINDKLIALMGWAKRGQLVIDKEEKLKDIAKKITKISDELWMIICTSNEQGKEWEWWE